MTLKYCSVLTSLSDGTAETAITSEPQYKMPVCYQDLMKYRVSQEEWTKLRESVPYVELY